MLSTKFTSDILGTVIVFFDHLAGIPHSFLICLHTTFFLSSMQESYLESRLHISGSISNIISLATFKRPVTRACAKGGFVLLFSDSKTFV
jgi:hypothetical protein